MKIETARFVLLGAQHLAMGLDPHVHEHKKCFAEGIVQLSADPPVFPFSPPFIRSDQSPPQKWEM